MATSLNDYLQKKRVPLMVYLELTHRCSFLCIHCYIPESLRWPEPAARKQALGLTTAEVKKVLHDLADCQSLFLVFTGGEIFLRPDLLELSECAVQLGFSLKYYTNGFHITPAWADDIKRLGIYAVDLSVYGANEETYRTITKVRGGFERVVKTLKLLKDRNIRFTVKTPVLKQNFREIPAIKALAEEYGGYFRYDLVIVPRFDGDQTPLNHRLDDLELEILLKNLGARFEKSKLAAFEPHGCAVGKWSAVIAPDGEVYPCIELRRSMGNVRQRPFAEIWDNSPVMSEIRSTMAKMRPSTEVFADGLCHHCPAHAWHSTGDMTQASPEYQRIASVKRKFLQP